MNNLIQKYNTSETLIVISSYPKKKETYSKGVCAVASFAKNTLSAIKNQYPGLKIVVLTMIIDKEEAYEEDDVLIIRCFSRNNVLSYAKLFSYIRHFTQTQNILVEFEFASFGNTMTTGVLMFFMWTLYALKKRITIVVHQVVLDLATLSGHIGIAPKDPLIAIFNVLLRLYYKVVTFPASAIIVLEDGLKNRLARFINPAKIHVISHGVDAMLTQTISKHAARNAIRVTDDTFVILYFGYITWYKGVDFLLRVFYNNQTLHARKVKLIIAGGPSFTQQRKKHYNKYYQNVMKMVKNTPQSMITGFVKEEDIPLYFTACDLVVFPYRTFMSSSGPFATALSFEKPFLVSKPLAELLESRDIRESLQKAGVDRKKLLFALTKKDFVAAILRAMDKNTYQNMEKVSRLLRTKRSFATLALRYGDILFPFSPNEHKNIFAAWKNSLLYNCSIVSRTIASRVAPFTRRL